MLVLVVNWKTVRLLAERVVVRTDDLLNFITLARVLPKFQSKPTNGITGKDIYPVRQDLCVFNVEISQSNKNTGDW